jgi:hypothetical protein
MKTTPLALAAALSVALPAAATAAERGTLKNNTKITLTYQAGYADATGKLHLRTYRLAPGQSHAWTVRDPQRQPLVLVWDKTLGDGKYEPSRINLFTRPAGFVSAFFRFGNLVMIDISGGAR